jgi:hypothetical protein
VFCRRRAEEASRAQEIAEREVAALQAEERFASLAEEADVKTRKLKKMLKKFKVCWWCNVETAG